MGRGFQAGGVVSIAPSEAPYYSDDHVTLWHGDALDVLRDMDFGGDAP